jgi:hypothetical protein
MLTLPSIVDKFGSPTFVSKALTFVHPADDVSLNR